VAALLESSTSEADPLNRVRAWIASECHRPLTITDLARAAGMSRPHFWRTFVQRFGLTPRAYMVQCRIQRAATLLQNTKDPIKELVGDIGYSHAKNFATAFKRVHGSTPKAFRSQDCPPSPKNTELDWDE